MPKELQTTLSAAQRLVDAQHQISDAITAAKRQLTQSEVDLNVATSGYAAVLSQVVRGKAGEVEADAAEKKLLEVRSAKARVELLLDGLRKDLTDSKTEKSLREYEEKLGAIIPQLGKAAIADWRKRFEAADRLFRALIAEGSALGVLTGTTLLTNLPARPLLPGQPTRYEPHVTILEIEVPRIDFNNAILGVSDQAIARLVKLRSDLAWAVGTISSERNRAAKERYRAARTANGGIARHAGHPSAIPAPARPLDASPAPDPDLRSVQYGIPDTITPVMGV